MASDSFVNHPLCVEWTTNLPCSVFTTEISPEISVGGLESNLQLKYIGGSKLFQLRIIFKNSVNTSLLKCCPITTFIQHPSTREPILTDIKLELFHNILWHKSRNVITEKIPDIINTNKLTIICLFQNTEHNVEKKPVSTQTSWTTAPLGSQSLYRKFSSFLKNESLSDVKLNCADRIFSGHKLVLAANSEVFAAMFRNKMAESEAGVVYIKDVDPEVLDLLLQYMYLGELPDLCEDTAPRLYEAADKYAVHDLRWACSNWMVEHLTTENCLNLLVLAEKHSDENFKEAVLSFIAENLVYLSTKSWSTLKEKYPLLVISVLEKCMEDSLPGEE